MHWRLEKEYELMRGEIIAIQSCITEYMKMFYGAAAAFIGAYGLFLGHDKQNPLQGFDAYVPLFLAYIVLSFATVIFHKFNTHNRYAGYARALTQEVWGNEKLNEIKSVHLWESVVGFIYAGQKDFIAINLSEAMPAISRRLKRVKHNCDYPSRDWRATSRKIALGMGMMLRATIFRAKTLSWTYAFQVAFAPFATTIILLGIWIAVLLGRIGSPYFVINLGIQITLVSYLFASWCGLAYRLYRLCGNDGDRTIEAYCLHFMKSRYLALAKRDISVTYISYPLKWPKL
jgi:hypothetical protein